MKLRIALVQFGRDRLNKPKNINRMLSTLSKIKNTDIVCLPEAWTGAGLFLEEKERESLLSSLCELAAEKDYNLLTGGLFNRRGEKIFDTCHIINRDGKIIGFYDKRFPSTAFNERDFCSPGNISPVFRVDDINIGVVICVDALYPELTRSLALNNACIIFNPSNIPKNRNKLWKYLSVTRAAENTVFYVFVNNTNTFYPDGRMVKGHSVVVAPDGEVILEADEEEKVFKSELDLEKIDKIRKRWRYLDDIRSTMKFL
ncbi:MAG: carbon-nitrogen hydrolase family protein [Candidatus Bathyarchaeia archaeon]